MGIFNKLANRLIAATLGKKAFTSNPFLGFVIEADESEVIADELFSVGMAYQQGAYMLPADTKKAIQYFRKAAERGHAVAQLFMVMATMRYHDDHSDEVMDWLHKAADQGEKQAMYNLGISYHRGDVNGMVDITKSFDLFSRAAEKGYGGACGRLATIYWNGGDGVPANPKIAKFWALEAFLLGNDNDKGLFPAIASEEDIVDNKANVDKILREACEEGVPHAIYRVGDTFVSTDIKKAAEYWTKAAEKGSLYAKCNLAIYASKELKDYTTANKLFEEAAKFGIEKAQVSLAESYYFGMGVEKDIAKAWYWTEKALNLGSPEARYLLAMMCIQNALTEILPDNVMRGASYMEQAARDNYPPALEFFERQQTDNPEFSRKKTVDSAWYDYCHGR